jgi:histidine triad (HIT) family protein
MKLSPEQKKAIEQQKENCIFCQIIAGKVPSNKVYEDKQLIGILDINPASKGHILFMPKEHYPIMPIIPPDTFKQMVGKLKEVDKCVKDALLCKETTVFIANGGAAGQQSTHFMLHIIPREGGDGLDILEPKEKDATADEIKEVEEKTGEHLAMALSRSLPDLGYTDAKQHKMTKKQLLRIIDENPQLKDAIINNTEEFRNLVPRHNQLSQLFKDADIDEIIREVKAKKDSPKEKSLDDALGK